jgi:uncharacterized phage protein (TIGR02218 family)
MKSISTALKAHLAQEVTSVCTCWKVTLKSGQVLGFTDHDENVSVGGATYVAASGYTASAVQTSNQLNVDQLELQGVLEADTINEADLLSGKWDYAVVEIFQVNWADTSQGALNLRTGRLGEVSIQRGEFRAELRGMMQQFTRNIGELYQPTCRAEFGDSRCKVNLAAITKTSTVATVDAGNRIVTLASALGDPAGHYDYGKLTFTSGANNTLAMEIKSYVPETVALQLPMPFPIAVGDAVALVPGCQKRFIEDCKARFNNVVNFRGEPHLPGMDKISIFGAR